LSEVREALVVVSGARAAQPRSEALQAYRTENPDMARFGDRVLFVSEAAELRQIQQLIASRGLTGLFSKDLIVVADASQAVGTVDADAAQSESSLLLEVRGKTGVHGTLAVSAKLILSKGEVTAVPGLERLGAGIFSYLPLASPVQWLRILKEAIAKQVAVGTAA
jgi:hypothetical protein